MKCKKSLSVLLALILAIGAIPAVFAAAPAKVKNVILMIGDGMGENHLALAREQGVDLFMDANCDLRGQSKTRSFSNRVTDSAAGGTALSCGVRVSNSAVAVYPIDPNGVLLRPRSITENALAHGMKTGAITTDKTTGATPAAFSAHTSSRNNDEDITAQQIESDIDLIWGAATEYADRETVEANGRIYVSDAAEMEALTAGTFSFAQFTGDFWHSEIPNGCTAPTLEQMSVKAIELLSANNENGFFLMIEGAHIDKNSHRTRDEVTDYPEKTADVADAVKGFDNAIRAAVEFARADGNTIVLVTADHETGDLYLENGRYAFHSGSHTGKNVPVLVFGSTDLFPNGKALKNREVPVLLAGALGWSAAELPHADAGTLFKKLFALLKKSA